MNEYHNQQSIENTAISPPQEQHYQPYNPDPAISHPGPVYAAPNTSSPPILNNESTPYSPPTNNYNKYEIQEAKKSKKQQWIEFLKKRPWVLPLLIFGIILAILFEVYKSDFERWVKPLTDWFRDREEWSWVIPVVILIVLSFPPLFGHEIVQLVVGLAFPLGIAIGIAIAGAILGEAACFIVFKYGFTKWVDKKIAQKIKWAAIARVTQEAGFKGVCVIRYSIVPPHLANPLFACTGMSFWLYMSTVIISLPKSIVFVALGAPSSENSKVAKVGKVIAIGVLVIVTIFASRWMRTRLAIATKEIQAERAAQGLGGDEELGMLREGSNGMTHGGDTSYKGVSSRDSVSHDGPSGAQQYQGYSRPQTEGQDPAYGMAR